MFLPPHLSLFQFWRSKIFAVQYENKAYVFRKNGNKEMDDFSGMRKEGRASLKPVPDQSPQVAGSPKLV
jgi:hypothetical protein